MSANDAWNLALALLLVAALAGGVRLAFATPDERRTVATSSKNTTLALASSSWVWFLNIMLALWVLASWRRLTRNLGLAYADKYAVIKQRSTDKNGVTTEKEHPKITYPHRFVRPDAYGVVLTVWTRPGIGRAEFEKVAEHLANTWRCRRVQIEQRKPGRITVRALRRDPLDARLSLTVPQLDEERDTNVEHIRPVA